MAEPLLQRNYSARTVQRQYARVAWFYDAWGRLTEDRALRRLLELAEIRDGCRALEVGVGTGRLFAGLLERNPSGRNEGIDLSPDMLAHARRRIGRVAAGGSAHLQEASAYDLPFDDGSFDIVLNTFMIDLLPEEDFPRVLGEFRRVLEPGGKVAIACFSHGRAPANRFWVWTARHLPALLTGCRPVRLDAPLREAGFEIVRHEEISQNTFPSAIYLARRGE